MSLVVSLQHRQGDFDLDIGFSTPGGITALFGASGSGKTTIVNAVAGLLAPDQGRISINDQILFDSQSGTNLPPHKRRIGYVFQEGRLFPHLTVRQNLLFGRWFSRHNKGEDFDRIVDLLGISALLSRRPTPLSGGEKQRVAIGRALLSDPGLLLMDEPLAGLDDARKDEILPYLQRLRSETRMPILYVSHSVDEVARLADTIVALKDGKVARQGPAEAFFADPESLPIMGPRASGALLPARVLHHDDKDGLSELKVSGGQLFLPRLSMPVGAKLTLRIRPHDIMLSLQRPDNISALNVLPVTITSIYQGPQAGAAVGLVSGQDKLIARVTRRSVRRLGLTPGLTCFAVLKSTAVARRDIGAPEAPK